LAAFLPWCGPDFRESALLSTCNRFEVYGVPVGAARDACALMVGRLADVGGLTREELEPHIYQKEDREAVEHLLRVACGLDSQLLGETQILGQVSQSLAAARASGTTGPQLTYLFSRAAHAGKRARSETEISRGATSIGHAAVTLLEKELGDLSARTVLVVGAGEIAELAVRALCEHAASEVWCINRSMPAAQALAVRNGCRARPWAELPQALASVDAVISATGAPHAVIYAEDVEPVLERRQGLPLVLMDIAVPRDVDLAVGALPGVVLHDIDKLEATLDRNLRRRWASVPRVEDIISTETEVVMDWLHGRDAKQLVAELRERARSVADAELGGALRKLNGLDEDAQEIVARMANRIVGKLLHQPTKRLKSRASSEDFATYCDAVVDLFGLTGEPLHKPEGLTEAGGGG
ncbi:MAG: glutamyl-tRNA reductase, partial [Acidobacteria bacterium RBG_16_64_8]